MFKSVTKSLIANQNTIALSAIAITCIGGSAFIAWCASEMKKDEANINEMITEFNKNYAS